MKFILNIDPQTLKDESFPYLEPDPVPAIISPENPEEANDAGPAGTEAEKSEKQKPS